MQFKVYGGGLVHPLFYLKRGVLCDSGFTTAIQVFHE